jgi:hypothetical protein
MTTLDTLLRRKAFDAIALYGAEATFYLEGRAAFEPSTGEWTSDSLPLGVEATYAYKVSPPAEFHAELLARGLVEEGAMRTTLPAKGLNATFEADYLRNGLKMTLLGDTWQVTGIKKIYSGEQVAAYDLMVEQRNG